MKITKSQRSNIIFLGVLALIFLTPLRGVIQEYMSKLRGAVSSVSIVENGEFINEASWQLRGLNTANVNLKDLKGEVVFINFWATWCPPCRAEMPSIQKLYNSYEDKVSFIMVSNEEATPIELYMQNENFNFPSFVQQSITPDIFPVSSIPTTYIVNKEGQIVAHEVGPLNWNSKGVHELLDELLQ
ncbi:TlpA disulfide reductase family protein [Urechidicola sp. KH5]